jgi:putative membrane protein
MGMAEARDEAARKVARGLLAGLVAGAAAAFAMDRFQAVMASLSSGSDEDNGEPATEQAADRLARAATGEGLSAAVRPVAGQALHYALGIGLGAAYGIAAEFRPSVTAGYGSSFGLGTAVLLDEGAVPALGLGEAPWRADLATTGYAVASHLVFGGVAEFVRRQVRSTLG